MGLFLFSFTNCTDKTNTKSDKVTSKDNTITQKVWSKEKANRWYKNQPWLSRC